MLFKTKSLSTICCICVIATLLAFLPACNKESQNPTDASYDATLQYIQHMLDEMDNDNFEELYNDDTIDLRPNGVFAFSEPDKEYNWSCTIVEIYQLHKSMDENNQEKLCYAFYDLNQDGNDELLILSSDLTLYAIFSKDDETTVLLDSYWSRYRGMILDSEEIYTYGTGGAEVYEYAVSRLDPPGDKLIVVDTFGFDTGDYYRKVDDVTTPISEGEFNNILETYPDFWDRYDSQMQDLQLELKHFEWDS